MIHWSGTTGANVLGQFERNAAKGKETRYRAKALGVDHRGDQKWNEFLLVAVEPTKSNLGFSTVKVLLNGSGSPIELRLFHNSRYLAPDAVAPSREA